jgi:hypothetical protein
MNDTPRGEGWRAFEEELRCLASRAPSLSDHAAAQAVLTRLPERRRSSAAVRLAAAAVLIAVAAVGTWLGTRRTVSTRNVPPEALAASHLPSNVMLFWIDPNTPVYFVMSPVGSGKRDTS